jgi:uncharacterized protein (DUF1015 family)
MADIQAFRGLRYDLSQVGSLSEVVAPPYDVISAEQQSALYDANEFNVVRLILPRSDDLIGEETIYDRAAGHLKDWRRDGVLRADGVATVYVYHQRFEFEGQQFERHGFISRVRLEPFGEGDIYPHEQTHSKAKEDRYRMMTRCKANLSPIFGIYPDPENRAQEILEAAIEDRTPLTAIDPDGVTHELWQVTNPEAIAAAATVLGSVPVYIADGHHRYETSCRIAKEAKDAVGSDEPDPTDYAMMMFVSMSDRGLAVLPTHRLFRGVGALSSDELIKRVGDAFEVEVIGNGASLASEVWERIQLEAEQSNIGLYCRADDCWVLAKLTVEGMASMESLEPDKSDDWRSLGVSLLHRLLIEEKLGLVDLPAPKYVHEITEVIEGIQNGDSSGRDATGQAGTGEPFELVALVMPASVDDVKCISEQGLRMPAKSTYFYPKLLSGLVINPLE